MTPPNTVRIPYAAAVAAAVMRPPQFFKDLLEASAQYSGSTAEIAQSLTISVANFRRLESTYGNFLEAPAAAAPEQPAPPPPPAGPGTQLKGLLRLIGIEASPNCSCNARAKQMDEWGPDECEQRLPEIVDWLGEEAKRRGLPYMRLAGEQIVKLAIRRARKAASSAT